jgi:hypothetical protein
MEGEQTQQGGTSEEETPISMDTTPVGEETSSSSSSEEAQDTTQTETSAPPPQTNGGEREGTETATPMDQEHEEEIIKDLDLKADLNNLSPEEYKKEIQKYQRLMMKIINDKLPQHPNDVVPAVSTDGVSVSAASKKKVQIAADATGKKVQNSAASSSAQGEDSSSEDEGEEQDEEVETKIKKIFVASDCFKESSGLAMIRDEDKVKLTEALRGTPALIDQFQHFTAIMSAASKEKGIMKTQYNQALQQKNAEIKELKSKNKELEESTSCIKAIQSVFNSAAGKFADRDKRLAPSASAPAAKQQTKIETTKSQKKTPKITMVESSQKKSTGNPSSAAQKKKDSAQEEKEEEETDDMDYSNFQMRKRSAEKSGLTLPNSVVPPIGNSAASGGNGNKKARTDGQQQKQSVELMRQEVNNMVITRGLSAFADDLKTAGDAQNYISQYIQAFVPQSSHSFDPLGMSAASKSSSFSRGGSAPTNDNLISLVLASKKHLDAVDVDPNHYHQQDETSVPITQRTWATPEFYDLTNFVVY